MAAFFFCVSILLAIAFIGVLGGEEAAEVLSAPSGVKFVERTVEGTGESKILVIPLTGIIADVPDRGLLHYEPSPVRLVLDQLKVARRDPDIVAVVLNIDSPGGGITASDVLYHELTSYRKETGVHLIALLGDVGASGAYYVASAAERIVAHPTSITGSIGVIMPLIGIKGLLTKLGIESRPIKSGRMKDLGSIFRGMTDEERKILQRMVDELHGRFVSVVQEGMKRRGKRMPLAELRRYCDGRIFTGVEAKRIGLVDETGYFEDAVRIAASRAGKKPSETRVITYRRRAGFLEMLLSRAAAPRTEGVLSRIFGESTPRFMYLWTVGQPILASTPR